MFYIPNFVLRTLRGFELRNANFGYGFVILEKVLVAD